MDPVSIAAGHGAVWVANAGSGSVTQIGPASGKAVGASLAVGPQPNAIAAGADAVWVTSKGTTAQQSHNIIRIGP